MAILGTRGTLPLGYTKHRKKEKLGFIEGSCVTKSYSEESIFLEDRIVDVNEVWRKRNENFEIKRRSRTRENNQFYSLRICRINRKRYYIFSFLNSKTSKRILHKFV